MRLVLVVGLLVVAGCARSRLPAPYPPVSAEASVVTTKEAAVEAVLGWLSDPSLFEPDPIQVIEAPGEWTVALRYALAPGTIQTPDRALFRVSKATGAVDVPYPLR